MRARAAIAGFALVLATASFVSAATLDYDFYKAKVYPPAQRDVWDRQIG